MYVIDTSVELLVIVFSVCVSLIVYCIGFYSVVKTLNIAMTFVIVYICISVYVVYLMVALVLLRRNQCNHVWLLCLVKGYFLFNCKDKVIIIS